MSATSSHYPHTAHADPQDQPQPRSRRARAWLALARVVWLLFAALTLVPFILSLPDTWRGLQAMASDTHSGIPEAVYAWVALSLICLAMLVATVIACMLFLRRSDNIMALLAGSFIMVNVTSVLVATNTGDIPADAPVWLQAFAAVLALAVYYGFFLLFPTGRFVPRWTWMLIPLWVVAILTLDAGGDSVEWLVVSYPLFYGAAILFQIYRYRRVSTAIERQQTKWVAFGLVTTLVANQVFWLPSGLTPLGATLYQPISFLVYILTKLLVPITFFIAIQSYGLYEIDRIINKALVYGVLSVIVVAVYITGVIGFQALARTITGQESPIALVASTLLIAGLFQPLRRRIQKAIDRRFYRAKYDAAKTVAAFSATLRQEVSLTELQERLVSVVNETMQPASASLWLAPPHGAAQHPARAHVTANQKDGVL
jgi:hypothetical protein